ncbi:hypothetical protein PCANC_15386 [Puccinia coronata f. sp. avenae]|uniref:Acyl-protein thioesterase 1 n=1 Tax=Puccinia coronata f. sp. avenae TaxID=200324 RepID=A0A2N5V135_9BASI|nr:hypothetical protein PCANC_15386 [Puccinia coronata f. sp. avenae]PLW43711.1 hypothetical protein PCASD_08275 [Puccinia coronata f. sp. avenae]
MNTGDKLNPCARLLVKVKPVVSSVEALTFKASFLKRSYHGTDLRSLHLSTEKASFKNPLSDSPYQPTHSFGITLRPPRKTLSFYLCLFLAAAALIVMVCLTVIGFGERSHCLDCANSVSNHLESVPSTIPPREQFTPSEYRANWTKPTQGVSAVAFDVIPPLDQNNGRGFGWTVFFIHGLGDYNASASYHWRESLLASYLDPLAGNSFGNLTGLQFIFPKAHVRPVTVYSAQKNQGARPGWFDIKDWSDLYHLEDEEGLRQSAIGLSTILKDEALAGRIQLNQTIIAGFSQGAVMSILLTLALPQPPAACIMMSGYLPLPLRLVDLGSSSPAAYKKTSFYWLHGTNDAVLKYNQARSGMKLFSALFSDKFLRGKFKTFLGLQHGFNADEEKVASNYIDGIVSRNTGGLFDSSFDAYIEPENEGDVIQSRLSQVRAALQHRVLFGTRYPFSKDDQITVLLSQDTGREPPIRTQEGKLLIATP